MQYHTLFFLILGKMLSAAVVIGALRVNYSLFLIGQQLVPLKYRNLDDLVWGPSV